MKAIRIATLGVALVVGSAVAASAQGGGAPPAGGGAPMQQGGGRPNAMMKDITLTAEQTAKMADIDKKYAPEMQAVRDLAATDRAAAGAKRTELMGKINPEKRAVLTAEQQAVWDKNAADMKAAADARAKAAPPVI